MNNTRVISEYEFRLLRKMLKEESIICKGLLNQVKNALVVELDKDGNLEFVVNSNNLLPIKRGIPVEAETVDIDGVKIHLLIHVIEGRINELEIFKEDGTDVIERPDPEKLSVYYNYYTDMTGQSESGL